MITCLWFQSRYLRELDFARVDFYERTSLYKTIRSFGGGIVQGAATIRYRRFIKPFTFFDITTKIIYWDAQSIFMESRFIGKDGFIHAIAICKQRVTDCSAEDIMEILLKATPTNETSCEKLENGDLIKLKPEMPLEVISSTSIYSLIIYFLYIFFSYTFHWIFTDAFSVSLQF